MTATDRLSAPIVHENVGEKPDLFWRSFYAIVMVVAILIGIALALGPIVLCVATWNVWALITLPLVPLGGWIAVKSTYHARKLMWHFSHLPEYRLFVDRVEAAEWPNMLDKGARIPEQEDSFRRTLYLRSITSAVVSFAIVRQSMTPNGRYITETAPVLYLRYGPHGNQSLMSVPFPSHGDDGVDRWLGHLSAQGIPLYYTPRFLFRHDTQILDDAGRLRELDGATDLVPYAFSGGWLADEAELRQRWLALQQEHREIEEERDPALKEARAKHSWRTWIFQTQVFVWMGLAVFLQQVAVTAGHLNPGNMIPSFLTVFLFGLLFFQLLRSYLRWPYMFIYSGGVLVAGFMMMVATVDSPLAEMQVAENFLLAAVVFQPFCWAPYFAIKKIAAMRRSR